VTSVRRPLCVIVLLVAALLSGGLGPGLASADPGGPFRRTTPRGFADRDAGGLVIGIPGGRAWGVEGALHPIDPTVDAARMTVDLAVDDPDVAEAFVRIAYYARADVRSRQLATIDSAFVRVGQERRIRVELAPPPGAVAYRVRVLGRLATGAAISRPDAIRVRWVGGAAEQGLPRPSLTRLLTDLP
jgi:hypothetical protein